MAALIVGCLILMAPLSAVGLYVYHVGGINNSGSPELAGEWKRKLGPLESPEEAKQADPEIQCKRFANGEWVMGLSRDSHGRWNPGGGTIVVKDSRGKIRAFFGHVCGHGYLVTFFHHPKSLDELYKAIQEAQYQEYQWHGE